MRKLAFIVVGALLAFAGTAFGQGYYGNQPPPPPPGYGQGYHHGYNQGDGQTVSCGSPQYQFQRCPTPGYWRDAQIVRQTSSSSCIRDRSWGFDRSGLWVDKGCSGVFAGGGGYGGGGYGGWQPDSSWNHRFSVSCGSPQYHYYFCSVDVGRHGRVYVRRQTSSSACIEGRTWGWNRAGVWVDRGCSAEFVIDRRW